MNGHRFDRTHTIQDVSRPARDWMASACVIIGSEVDGRQLTDRPGLIPAEKATSVTGPIATRAMQHILCHLPDES